MIRPTPAAPPALAVAAVLVLAGCGGEDEPRPAPSPTSATTTATPAPVATAAESSTPDLLSSITGLIAVAISVASAVIALYARRDSGRSARAAEEATRLQRERHHADLTPAFTASAEVRKLGDGFGDTRVRLTLRLDGPAGLTRLDQVTVRIRDDRPRAPVTAGGPSQRKLDQVVWGPYHLVPGVDGADRLGRTSGFPMRPGDEQQLDLKPSPDPSWIDAQVWADEYRTSPVRLEVECVREGYAPWTVLIDVDQPQAEFKGEITERSSSFSVAFRNVGTGPARQPSIATDHPGDDPTLTGTYRDVVEPGQTTQAVWIANTMGHTHEWVQVSWIDPRGAQCDQHGNLPF